MRRILYALLIVLALVLFTQATSGTALAWSPSSYHTVIPGETLSSIAMRYGVSTWSLANANGMWNPNLVYAGQFLVIPQSGYYNQYPQQQYPSFGGNYGNGGYQQQYSGSYYGNYGSYYGYSQYYPVPTWGGYGGGTYWVKYGDTLSSIAWRYGTTAWALAQYNGICNPNWIYAGMRLRIPGH
jgi:LysM repeat protein